MNDIITVIKKFTFNDFKSICLLFAAFIPAQILRLRCDKIWIIAESEMNAEDNGWAFFKWIRTNKPNERAYYIIDKRSEQYSNQYGNMINWGGFKHYLYYLASKYHVDTNFSSVRPNKRICGHLSKFFERQSNRIFLQHGVIKDNFEMFTYEKLKFRLFICGAKPEYDYLSRNTNYPKGWMKYTGLARFDDLLNPQTKDNVILIMPTWRRYLGYDINKSDKQNQDDFIHSEYFMRYKSLINSKAFADFLKKYKLTAKVKFHRMFEKYETLFKTNVPNIQILYDKYSVHELLMEAAILVTDYSSVFFDFAYMYKPVIYYQFDVEDYRKKHFTDGYFDYEKDGFGKIVKTENELLNEIERLYINNFVMEDKYIQRCKRTFLYHDNNNCKRIYEAIKEIK